MIQGFVSPNLGIGIPSRLDSRLIGLFYAPMDPKLFAREWLWFGSCIVATIVLHATIADFRLRDFTDGFQVAAFFYGVTGAIRLTWWAIKKIFR